MEKDRGKWHKAKTFHLSPLTFYHENGYLSHIRYRLNLFYRNRNKTFSAIARMGEEEEFFFR